MFREATAALALALADLARRTLAAVARRTSANGREYLRVAGVDVERLS